MVQLNADHHLIRDINSGDKAYFQALCELGLMDGAVEIATIPAGTVFRANKYEETGFNATFYTGGDRCVSGTLVFPKGMPIAACIAHRPDVQNVADKQKEECEQCSKRISRLEGQVFVPFLVSVVLIAVAIILSSVLAKEGLFTQMTWIVPCLLSFFPVSIVVCIVFSSIAAHKEKKALKDLDNAQYNHQPLLDAIEKAEAAWRNESATNDSEV